MVVVEGVVWFLNLWFDMWWMVELVVGGWIVENLGLVGKFKDVGDVLGLVVWIVNDLLFFVDWIGCMFEELEKMIIDGLCFDVVMVEVIGKVEVCYICYGCIVLWVIVVVFVVIVGYFIF